MADIKQEPVAESGWPPWVDQWVMPFIEDTGLWPVLVAFIGHVVVLIAPTLLMAWRNWNALAFAPVFLLAAISGWFLHLDLARGRGPGSVTATVLLTWVLGVVVAYWFDASGAF